MRRRKAVTRGRPDGSKSARSRTPSVNGLKPTVARLARELNEALEQQKATAEVLRVISSSPGELKPVFQAMLTNATRICQAELGMLWLADGDGFRPAALHGVPPDLAGMRQGEKIFHFDPEVPLGRLAQTKRLDHIVDARKEPAYIKGLEPFKELVDVFGARTLVLVPMLQDDTLVGVIAIYRKEVRPFTDKQIALVQNFAAQAVIAIENTRLLNELRQRTNDLRESLDQQTATSEVLKVISSSPGELQPVFNTLLANATRLCGAQFGLLNLWEQDKFHNVAVYNVPPIYNVTPSFTPHPGSGQGELVRTKQLVHIADLRETPAYRDGDPRVVALADLGGVRTIIFVPMLKDGVLIGTINIYRQEVRPFTGKQIELIKNFASQALIAIENTRLLNELRESLQHRQPRPTFSRSSAVRPSTCSRCCKRSSNRPQNFAMPTRESLRGREKVCSIGRRRMAIRRSSWITSEVFRSSLDGALSSDAPSWNVKSFKFPTCKLIRNGILLRLRDWAIFARSLGFPCCVRECPSGFSL